MDDKQLPDEEGGNRPHLQIQLFLQLNCKVANTLEAFSPKFVFYAVPEDEAKTLFSDGLSMAQVHMQISDHCKLRDIRAFNITSKTHFSLHSLQLSSYIHPYAVWCFKGESQMRAMSTIWKSCLDGAKQWAVSNRIACKYRHRLHLLFQKILKEAA